MSHNCLPVAFGQHCEAIAARNHIRRHSRTFAAALALLAGVFYGAPTTAADVIPELRIMTAYRSYSDLYQFAAAWQLPAPSWTRARRAELATGVISGDDEARPFLSIGPVWRLNADGGPFALEFGFSPTVLGGSKVARRDLGGVVHFTSSLTLARAFGQQQQHRIALRLQHLSNGGLNDDNPGLDTIGLSYSGNFGQ